MVVPWGATTRIAEGANLLVVWTFLGHKSLKATARYFRVKHAFLVLTSLPIGSEGGMRETT